MVQRPLDAYAALAPAERGAVDRYFAGTGCERLLAYRVTQRLEKRRFKLAFSD